MNELEQQLKNGTFFSCYLLYGEEPYLLRFYKEKLRKALLAGGDEMMNCDYFEEKKVDVEKVMDAGDTMPFLSGKRVIEIRDSGLFKSGKKNDSEAITNYIPKIPETSSLLFIEKEVDKRGKLFKAIGKYGFIMECKPLSENQLIAWIKKCFQRRDIQCETATAVTLLRTVGDTMDGLLGEIDKLSAYLGNKGKIENKWIEQLCVKPLELRIFDLVEALGGSNPQQALTIYRNLLKMKESPIMVLTMMTRQFRIVYECKVLELDHVPRNSICTKTGLRDFVVRLCLKQGQNFTVEALEMALKDCLQTDIDIKSGKMSGDMAVELLIVKYSTMEKKKC